MMDLSFRMKEEQMEQRKQKRMSAKQAQRNKDNALWEKNRMFRSGAVLRTDHDEDFEEISEAKVHLVSSKNSSSCLTFDISDCHKS